MDTVEMYHPELQAHIQVAPSAVQFHRTAGWITGKDDNPKYLAPEPAAPDEDTPADEPHLPAKSAPKGDWEQAARDAGVPDEDIDSMTKDELVARLTASKE